jgi:hypothetical protein
MFDNPLTALFDLMIVEMGHDWAWLTFTIVFNALVFAYWRYLIRPLAHEWKGKKHDL